MCLPNYKVKCKMIEKDSFFYSSFENWNKSKNIYRKNTKKKTYTKTYIHKHKQYTKLHKKHTQKGTHKQT